MKDFHISDLLTLTTGRLVGSRHMRGVYEILNFMTGDSLFTHQLPRAMEECEPWLRQQFPRLFPEDAMMAEMLKLLEGQLEAAASDADLAPLVAAWVESVRVAWGLPERVPVYELPPEFHTHIDPIEEARAMMGDDRVIVISAEDDA